MVQIIEERIIPHLYTYALLRAVRVRDSNGTYVRWFDLETGEEMPPCLGYGEEGQKAVDEWYAANAPLKNYSELNNEQHD